MQFQEHGKIVVFNLACRRVDGAHTAENIRLWLKEILNDFDIEEKQLLVVAVDSAANIQKAAKDFLLELEEKFAVDLMFAENEEENDGSQEEQVDIHSQIDFVETEDETVQEVLSIPPDLTAELPQELVPTSYKIACVAHQLQLAIDKFSEIPEIKNFLEASRRMSAKLRTPMLRRQLDQDRLPYGIIDQATRWASKAKMTLRLEELKDFCVRNEGLRVGLKAPPSFWLKLEYQNSTRSGVLLC